MENWSALSDEFSKYGINDYQCWDSVIPLDKVFGLDECSHSDGIYPYGVSDMSLFDRGVTVTFYTGDISHPTRVCTAGRFKGCGGNKRRMTDAEERGVRDYCESLIRERKARLEWNKYWLEHFDDFVSSCLAAAKKYIAANSRKYDVKLMVGSSQADTRVAPALVITYKGDGSQRGYVKILQNRHGDISLDACCMCHTTFDVKNPDDIDRVVGSACGWCL